MSDTQRNIYIFFFCVNQTQLDGLGGFGFSYYVWDSSGVGRKTGEKDKSCGFRLADYIPETLKYSLKLLEGLGLKIRAQKCK